MSAPCSCGCGCDRGGDYCGCCEGVEPLTPRAIANRPGLDAIAYRIGTQSAFLETMKARLSSHDFPALAPLTTRDGNDFSLALMDAWAVVADVLTFYQERIANEGYLRTATERRSVLELARLVGYAPRPGVSASTYLAYTLEEKITPIVAPGSPVTPVSTSPDQPEVVIPAGSRAQSVPGPGETAQYFETSEDLTARAAWNKLQVRLTRPQQPETLRDKNWDEEPKTLPLFLKGISTQLRPNDPLLLDFGTEEKPDAHLYRVLEAKADAVNDRTRIVIEPWWKETRKVTFSDQLQRAVALTRRPAKLQVPATVQTRLKRVSADLEALSQKLSTGVNDEDELRVQAAAVHSRLLQEIPAFQKSRSKTLISWTGGIAEAFAQALAAPGAAKSGPAAMATKVPDVVGSIGGVLNAQPRSSVQLSRDTQRLLRPSSSVTANLLAVARPELRDTLLTVLANTPVSDAVSLKAYALRLRASVFGHNAPLELVRRQRDGVILRSREWDLRLPATATGEAVEIRLSPSGHGQGMDFAVKLGDKPENPPGRLVFGQTTFQYPAAEEIVEVHLTRGDENGSFLAEITFVNRDVKITVEAKLPAGEQERFEVSGFGQQTRTVTVKRAPAQGDGPISRTIEVKGMIADGPGDSELADVVFLDNAYPQVAPGTWIVLERPDENRDGTPLVIAQAQKVKDASRAAYGLSGKSTRIQLSTSWLHLTEPKPDTFAVVRGTAVFAQSEELALAEAPIEEPLCESKIELAGVYDGLKSGRWLIVSGERTDVGEPVDPKNPARGIKPGTEVRGVRAAELAMLADLKQGVQHRQGKDKEKESEVLPGERNHSTLTLATSLTYCYKRDTVTVYGNVAHATHGETRSEVLGSGDASKALQSFALKQPPLTWISAPTPSGIASTLTVRVNDVRWHLAGGLAELGPADRSYILRTDDGGQTTVVFGNGERGARLPTGAENARAAYRSGIGKGGNVQAGQISQLASRPLGVKDVINPLPATGGADRESRDQARRNAPLAVLALDRLISVQDYEDLTRTFAGVGKAKAVRLPFGGAQIVYITIAGEDDIPVQSDSDLLQNLTAALYRFGDPDEPLQVAVRSRTFLVVEAEVRLLADYFWDAVEPKIRAAMLDAFGFARRDLGEDALLSEVYATIQGVRGVDRVDVNVFARKDPEDLTGVLDKGKDAQGNPITDVPAPRLRADAARIDEHGALRPAQLLYLTPEVADTLILKEKKS